MQTTDLRDRDDGPSSRVYHPRDPARPVQGASGPGNSRQDTTGGRAEDTSRSDDDGIETLPSDRADHPLDERTLLGTRRRGHDLGDAHGRHAALEGRAVNPVATAVKPARCRV